MTRKNKLEKLEEEGAIKNNKGLDKTRNITSSWA